MSSQEEECTSSDWGDSKMYTSGSIENAQGMLTKMNESSNIAKIRVWVESNAVKHERYLEQFPLNWKFHLS